MPRAVILVIVHVNLSKYSDLCMTPHFCRFTLPSSRCIWFLVIFLSASTKPQALNIDINVDRNKTEIMKQLKFSRLF